MILMIDHNDSFTYTIVDYIEQSGKEVEVLNVSELTLDKVIQRKPEAIFLSPGPGNPNDYSVTMEILQATYQTIPTFGVCLGFQMIVQVFGGKIVTARQPMHGKIAQLTHDSKTIFEGANLPLPVTRYHSLIAEKASVPPALIISATTNLGEVMAVRHQKFSIEAVQFHPEAILTEDGLAMIKQFIELYVTEKVS
ncbi:anthranilate synthase component II [Halalkalibacillus halophilus]|uniref:anthranilate synthase component II n=1 Tax=Halalkalibacillus halophilus TaxID=392827 RepID=UPI000409A16E|nr:aminodeoxychorismate/anthranilate synthase component II [Halalkalibacillus halophilus]